MQREIKHYVHQTRGRLKTDNDHV